MDNAAYFSYRRTLALRRDQAQGWQSVQKEEMLDTTEKLFTLSPPDGQFEMLLDVTSKISKMLMAGINGEAG